MKMPPRPPVNEFIAGCKARWIGIERKSADNVNKMISQFFIALLIAVFLTRITFYIWLLPAVALINAFRHSLVRRYFDGLIKDTVGLFNLKTAYPNLDESLLLWMAARKRLWKSLCRAAIWLVIVCGLAGLFIALDPLARGIGAVGMISLMFAPFCALSVLIRGTMLLLVSRGVGFKTPTPSPDA